MTSSGPIHHSRFPAQRGQAALRAVTTASSLAHFTQATWDRLWRSGAARERDQSTPGPRGKRGAGCSHFQGRAKPLLKAQRTHPSLCAVPAPARMQKSNSPPQNQQGSKAVCSGEPPDFLPKSSIKHI